MDSFETEFVNGEMRIKHPSGHITRYNRLNILAQRDQVLKDIEDYKAEVKYLDSLIKQIDASTPKPPLLKRLGNLIKRKG